MGHLVDKTIKLPYTCEDCKHFKGGLSCAAFDRIPLELYGDGAESHTSVRPDQKGDYIFETDKQRDTMRVYEDEEESGED